ncbi:MAG: MFS transporter [Burkholderiaceae bacterium]|nr:MFS transporter [Burkholderiaceae bacterium]
MLAAGLAFLLVGAGMQTAQTAGLALATDLASESSRPRVVALMYVMLLVGMVGSGFVFSLLLADFTHMRLIQVVQGTAVAGHAAQQRRAVEAGTARPGRGPLPSNAPPSFREAWRSFVADRRARRFLWAVALGTAAFSMQDILLEPYGGEVLKLSVGATSALTALMAAGSLVAFALAARLLSRGGDPYRVAGVRCAGRPAGFCRRDLRSAARLRRCCSPRRHPR